MPPLVIRDEQMAAFEEAQWRAFEAELRTHLLEHFADDLGDLPHDGLTRYIRTMLARARALGLHTKRGCCMFLTVARVSGWDFQGPSHPRWLARWINDPSRGDAETRIDAIVERCLEQLDDYGELIDDDDYDPAQPPLEPLP